MSKILAALDEILARSELTSLRKRFGSFPERHVALATGPAFRRKYAKGRTGRRRGETAFILERPDGRILLQTKGSYPAGIFRLPTGGVDWGEPIPRAFEREVHEETGYQAENASAVGLLTYEFQGEDGAAIPFFSMVFRAAVPDRDPVPIDDSEDIAGFRWIRPRDLATVGGMLRGIGGAHPARRDWGLFRAQVHGFCADLLV